MATESQDPYTLRLPDKQTDTVFNEKTRSDPFKPYSGQELLDLLIGIADSNLQIADQRKIELGRPTKQVLQPYKLAHRFAELARKVESGEVQSSIELLSDSSPLRLGHWEDVSAFKKAISERRATELAFESKYQVMRQEPWRANLYAELSKHPSESRTILEVDLVDLKGFNQVSPEFGDHALGTLANQLKVFLTEQGSVDPALRISRRGDEFYVDLGNLDPIEAAKLFNEFARDDIKMKRVVELNGISKNLNFYWRMAEVTAATMDHQLQRLEQELEAAKLKSISQFADRLNQSEDPFEQKLALTFRFLASKRISLDLLYITLELGAQAFAEYIKQQSLGSEASQFAQELIARSSDEDVVSLFDQIIQSISTQFYDLSESPIIPSPPTAPTPESPHTGSVPDVPS